MSAIKNEIEDRLEDCEKIYKRILKYNDPDDIEEVIILHGDLHQKIDELVTYMGSLNESNEGYDLQYIMDIYSRVDEFSRQAGNHISVLVVRSNQKAIGASKKGLINQLSIFSMFLTILTFVLNNAKLFSMENASFSMIMAGNISFILMCVVIFTMIYIFLHLDDRKEAWWKRVWRAFVIIGFITILSVLIFMLVEHTDNIIHIDYKKLLSLITQTHP